MKYIATFFFAAIFCVHVEAQGLKGLLNKAKQAVSGPQGALGNEDIVAGLKEALVVGSEKGSSALAKTDGFFANAALKILMPAEAQKIETTLRSVGMGSQVDEAILAMNRAAEDACKSAAPIFSNAIKQMSFQDALGILKGSDTAATGYLRSKTNEQLSSAFRLVIEQSLQKVDATKYWNSLITAFNRIPFQKKLNPDLAAHVTDRALNGIFLQVALEEKNIRLDPVARTTDLLRKVFGR